MEDAVFNDPEVSEIDVNKVNVIKSCNCDVVCLLEKLETVGKVNETLKERSLILKSARLK